LCCTLGGLVYLVMLLVASVKLVDAGLGYKATSGAVKSRKVLELRKTIFHARKVMQNSKGHGKSWKISILLWILWLFHRKCGTRNVHFL